MENQGKQLMIAVAVALAIMLIWQKVFPPEEPEPATDAVEQKTSDGAVAAPSPDGKPATDGPEATGEPAAAAVAERGEEVLEIFDFDLFRAEFTNYGGAVKSYQLHGDKYRDAETGGPQELVLTTAKEGLPFQIQFAGSTHSIPANAEWKGNRTSDREIEYSWESAELRVVKSFKLHPEQYLIELTVAVTNLSSSPADEALSVSLFSFQDPTTESGSMFGQIARLWEAGCLLGGDLESRSVKDLVKKGPRHHEGEVRWAGFLHSYFMTVVAVDPVQYPQMACDQMAVTGERRGVMRTDLVFPKVAFKSGDPARTTAMVAYFGPKMLDRLEAIQEVIGYEGDPQLDKSVDFGWFSIIGRPLLWLLKFFQSFVVNWGVAIILLTITVKLATLYWTHKSMVSMQSMAKLKPQLEKIKEKYPDDRERVNQETMNLFKTHGVNPLSGCLPMLLQMPIWLALYRMLAKAAELYQAPFIPGWLDDLTAPDPYYIMPVVLTGMMFVQSKLTPQTQTGMQQKMLQYGMPLMFGAFSFVFPSGLTLYIFTNVCLTAVHHLVLHKEGRAEAKRANAAGKTAGTAAPVPRVDSASEEGASEADDGGNGDGSGAAKASKRKGKTKKRSGKRKR